MTKDELYKKADKDQTDVLSMIDIVPNDIETVEIVFRNHIHFVYMKNLDEVNTELHKLRKTLGAYTLESYHSYSGLCLDLNYKFDKYPDVTFQFVCYDAENALDVVSKGKCRLVPQTMEVKKVVCDV